MTPRHLFAAASLAAALLAAAGPAAAAPTPLPVGATVTALQDGQPSLLGLDTGFAPGPGSNVVALTDGDLEFLSADFAIALDLFSDGLVQLYDNGGSGLAGTTVLQLAFSGLLAPLASVSVDAAALAGGSVAATLLDGHTLQLTLSDVQLAGGFGPLDIRLAVPEPSPLALLAVASLGAALLRRRPPARRRP